MRIGFNPNKDKLLDKPHFYHQVLVPVHIPEQQGYFKDSFQVLRLCLESLFKTCHFKTYITVIDNASCPEVKSYLDDLYKQGKLHELIQTTAIGKLNAILKGVTGYDFPVITITDADVLFLNDWQKATYAVFEAFPKAGVVSPVPNSKSLRYYTANVIWDTFWNKSNNFKEVKNPKAMQAFAQSIGNPELFKKIHLDKTLALTNNETTAVIGAGHFVATYRGQCFDDLAQRFSKFSLGGDSEETLLDKPASKLGLWRLSTHDNYAFHMGNVKENWMQEEFDMLISNTFDSMNFEPLSKTYHGLKTNFVNRFFSRIIFKKPFWQLYLRFKGLDANQANQY